MIRRCFLKALDQGAVPMLALAMALASTQSGTTDRERDTGREAAVVIGREVAARLSDAYPVDDPPAGTRVDALSHRGPLNPPQALGSAVPEFGF